MEALLIKSNKPELNNEKNYHFSNSHLLLKPLIPLGRHILPHPRFLVDDVSTLVYSYRPTIRL